MSTKMLLHKFMGTAAAGGYANFFTPGTSTPKSTYTSTTYATAEQADVPISSDGWIKTYLLGDYDMDVFDRNGTQIPSASADGINPQAASIANDPNLVPNGSFETDSNEDGTPDSWVLTSFSGATNARVSSDQRHGAHAMSFTSTGSGGGHVTTEDFIPVNPDVQVYIGFGIKSSVAGVRNVVDILWFTEGQATISTTSVYDDDTTNPTSWEFKSFHATPPSTAKYAKIRLYGCHSSDSTAGTTLYDDVQVRSVGIPEISAVATHNEDYTLKLSDAGKTLLKTSADSTTRTWTIPLNATVPFPIGTRIWGENQDDNNLTITATGAATLIGLNGATPADGDVTIAQGNRFELYKYASDAWSINSVAAVSGFVSGKHEYIKEDGGHSTALDVSTNVTENTFESVGPTGSLATNVWTAMDGMPSAARIAIIRCSFYALGDESAVNILGSVYIRKTGDSTAASNANKINGIQKDNNNLTEVPEDANFVEVRVPLDSSRRFDITWSCASEAAVNINLYFVGFVL